MLVEPYPDIYNFFHQWSKDEQQIIVTPLGGMTNSTYLVTLPNDKYVLKVLNPEISQSHTLRQLWAALLAYERGVGPKVYAMDLEHRAILMEFIEGKIPEASEMRVAVETLKKLHETLEIEPFSTIYRRYKQIPHSSDHWTKALDYAKTIEKIVRGMNIWPALCHLDFHKHNMLVDKDKAVLIDWESAGLGHPFYDLAKFSYQFTREESADILSNYLQREPNGEEKKIYFFMKSLVNLSIATNRYVRKDFAVAEKSLETFINEMENSPDFMMHFDR